MKTLTFLIFFYLLIPGSGRLVWDGLPLSTRAEFASLVVAVTALFSRRIRDSIRHNLSEWRWNGLVKPALVLLCAAKFLSFAWLPMSAGFEACYQSLYRPLTNLTDWRGEDLQRCEKSYEGPLLQEGGTGFANTSRVDSVVDFGRQTYDWRLPFINEYPRFDNLWLKRFPFVATYAAVVTIPEENSVLPVYSNGELSISVNGTKTVDVTNYDRHQLTALRLGKGSYEIVFRYLYRDDSSSTTPDTAPPPRGPYAALKIGAPRSESENSANSQLLISALAKSSLGKELLGKIIIRDRNKQVIEHTDSAALRDPDADVNWRAFDLEVNIPARALAMSPLEVLSATGTSTQLLATLTTRPGLGGEIEVTQPRNVESVVRFGAHLYAPRDSFEALRPDTRATPSRSLRLLLAAIDLMTLAVVALLLVTIVKTAGTLLAQSLAVGALAWLAIHPFYSSLPGFMGGGRELVVPYAILTGLIIKFRGQIVRLPLVFLLPISAILASQKIFEHLYFNHPGEETDWWGSLVFLWRDSDWFANQGNARATFVENSLRGGESVFWFRAGPRYLIMASHLMLGENDVLIGLVSLTVGFAVIWWLAAMFTRDHNSRIASFVGYIALYICMIFLGDQTTTAFAFFVSSEYPTWIIFFVITAFLLRRTEENRIWLTTLVAIALAVTVQFRPNGLLVAFALLPLVLLKTDRARHDHGMKQISWAVVGFCVVMSLSLIHNLYYGQQLVIFTPSPNNMYAVNLAEVFGQEGIVAAIGSVWSQLRVLMYWHAPHDPSFAIFFWGSQLLLAAAVFARMRFRVFRKSKTLVALIPLAYITPMVPFDLSSYYPRLLVSASLLCLCSALLIWPKEQHEFVQ